MATPVPQITSGDLDGDEASDLIGIQPGQGGVWVQYSSDSSGALLSSTADWIGAVKMRIGSGSSK